MFFKTQGGRGSQLQDLDGDARIILTTILHVVGVKLWREIPSGGGPRLVVCTVSGGRWTKVGRLYCFRWHPVQI